MKYNSKLSQVHATILRAPDHILELFFLVMLSVAIRHDGIWGRLITFGTILVVYFFCALFFSKKKSFTLSWLVAVVVSLASCIKTELLGIPLQLYDLQMVSQLVHVDGLSDISQFWEIHEAQLTFFYSSLVLSVYMLLSWNQKTNKKRYAWVLLLPVIGLSTIYIGIANVEPDIYDQMDNLKRYGAFGIVYSQAQKSLSMMPKNYSASIKTSFPVPSAQKTVTAPLPNIVLVLLESTIDPSHLKKITANPYPTPFFEKIKEKAVYGGLTVPGGTANAEYEVLTSLPLKSLPTIRVPFMEINRPTPSLPAFFSSFDYSCFAYHMGTQKFYNRDVVFKTMGIEKYYTRENYPDKKICVKRFYHDSTMFNSIYAKLQESKKPVFAHALTLIPHHPYDEKHAEFAFTIDSPTSDAEKKRLANYFSRIRHTQNDLAEFIAKLDTLPRRTLVLMYSDHLPPLSSIRAEGEDSLFYLLYDTKGQLKTGKNTDLATYELATLLLQAADFPLRGIDAILAEENNTEKLQLIHFDMLYGEQYLQGLYK